METGFDTDLLRDLFISTHSRALICLPTNYSAWGSDQPLLVVPVARAADIFRLLRAWGVDVQVETLSTEQGAGCAVSTERWTLRRGALTLALEVTTQTFGDDDLAERGVMLGDLMA